MTPKTGDGPTSSRLVSWKQIAAYLGREERTVKRWEATRGLPVRRMPGGRSTVYALTHDIDAWLSQTDVVTEAAPATLEAPQRPAPESSGVESAAAERGTGKISPSLSIAVVFALLLVCGLGLALWSRPRRAPPVNPDGAATAAELYAKGVFAWNSRTPAGLNDAIADFSRAILVEPNNARAFAGLADCYALAPEFAHIAPGVSFPQAKVAAERAVALDGDLAGGHSALAFVDFWWSHDVGAARREFDRALRLDPNSALTHLWYANALTMTGEFPRALAEIARAQALDPDQTAILADKAVILFDAGRTREALDILRSVESARPEYAEAHGYLASILLAGDDLRQALQELTWSAKMSADPSAALVAQAATRGYQQGGRAGMLHGMLQQQSALYRFGGYSPFALAQSMAAADPERTLSLLEQSRQQAESIIMSVGVDYHFRPLHHDKRFRAFVTRLGLPPLGPETQPS